MEDSYRNDPDPGIHGAVGWLLRRWGRSDKLNQVDQEMRTGKVEGRRLWYISTKGQTFVIMHATVRFQMGSPAADPARNPDEGLHWQRIDRTFALATTQVTVEQFKRFTPQFEVQKDWYPQPNCPVGGITWYEAVEYCNWLSKQEGLSEKEWCYEPNHDGKYAEGMKIAAGYLGRTGYRLPTEAEWEYACRAGAATSRYYGETKDLLRKYAWYKADSQKRTWPGGSLKPNDLGLFNMHGNLWTWCQDRYLPYGVAAEGMVLQDKEDEKHLVNDLEVRVLRGGSFDSDPRYVRAAYRHKRKPGDRHFALGFRLAKTVR
jgi:formylglycine-generating enzyme required for sulfatase activity